MDFTQYLCDEAIPPHDHILYQTCSDWYASNGRYVLIGLSGFARMSDKMSSSLV